MPDSLNALDWQEVFLEGAMAVLKRSASDPDALVLALTAMAAKAREIAERGLHDDP